MEPLGRYPARWRITAPLAVTAFLLGARATGRAQEATPVAAGAGELDELLAIVPATVASAEDVILATFADIAEQLAAVTAERPDSIADEARLGRWRDALAPLAIAEPFRTGALSFGRDQLGFDLTDVDALLETGSPPETVLVLRGRFDHDRLAVAWSASGYATVNIAGTQVASRTSQLAVDTSSEIGRATLGRLNNACLLADNTLVYTASLERMRDVLGTAGGNERPLAQRTDIRMLLDAQVDRLVTGILFSGLAISGPVVTPSLGDPGGADALATQIAELGEMPPSMLGLVGITAGGPLPLPILGNATPDPALPVARVIYSLLMAQPGTAAAAGKVAKQRLATMDSIYYRQPYRELFAAWETTVLADGDVLRLEITLPPGTQAGVWSRHLFARDLLFLTW